MASHVRRQEGLSESGLQLASRWHAQSGTQPHRPPFHPVSVLWEVHRGLLWWRLLWGWHSLAFHDHGAIQTDEAVWRSLFQNPGHREARTRPSQIHRGDFWGRVSPLSLRQGLDGRHPGVSHVPAGESEVVWRWIAGELRVGGWGDHSWDLGQLRINPKLHYTWLSQTRKWFNSRRNHWVSNAFPGNMRPVWFYSTIIFSFFFFFFLYFSSYFLLFLNINKYFLQCSNETKISSALVTWKKIVSSQANLCPLPHNWWILSDQPDWPRQVRLADKDTTYQRTNHFSSHCLNRRQETGRRQEWTCLIQS